MTEHHDVVVIGAGQAGLAVSHELTRAEVEHVVLERGRVAQTWRDRWDSFCLVTPNWTVRLPGQPYDRDDPEGFMRRDEIVAYLERYATRFAAPVHDGVEVHALAPGADGGFDLATAQGAVTADAVAVCTGAYQRPRRPAAAGTLPAYLLQIDVPDYRRPEALPQGPVLVVGSGQSGCQIAEELHLAGRDVFLACGRAAWSPRRIDDRDIFWWALETGHLDMPVSALASPEARLAGNLQATGRDRGHDLHYRTLQAMGVTLLGHFRGVEHGRARFAADLAATVAAGDLLNARLMELIRRLASERGMPTPAIVVPEPFDAQAPEQLDLNGFGAVVFATGFRPDYTSWMHFTHAFDDLGFPLQRDGVSTVVDDLYFAGVHYLRKRKSALLIGTEEDSVVVARHIVARATARLLAR